MRDAIIATIRVRVLRDSTLTEEHQISIELLSQKEELLQQLIEWVPYQGTLTVTGAV